MKQLRSSFLWVIALVSLSGCVTTNATMLGQARARAALAPQQIEIYRTAAQVPGQYEEMALLHSKGPSTATNEVQMYESMKQKAAELGANAIILDAISEPSAGAKIAGAFLGYAPERQGKAIAIYVHPAAVPLAGATAEPPSPQPVALQATGGNPTVAAESQMRDLDREFRAGRIGLEEYRRLKKVLQPE